MKAVNGAIERHIKTIDLAYFWGPLKEQTLNHSDMSKVIGVFNLLVKQVSELKIK